METIFKKFVFKSSITFRLMATVIGMGLLLGTITIFIVITITKDELTDVINQQQLAFSQFIANEINEDVKTSIDFVNMLANNISKSVLENLSDIEPRLESGVKIPSVFNTGVVLISADGKKVLDEYPIVPGRKQRSFDRREWFVKAISADGTIFSKPYPNSITNEPTIVFAAPVKNDQGNVLAVLAASMVLTQPEGFKSIKNLKIGGSGVFFVISPVNKLCIASNESEMILNPTPLPGQNELHDRAMDGYRGIDMTVNAFGVKEVTAISTVDITGWFVVVRLPVEEAYLPMEKLSKTLLIYLSLLIIAFISVIVAVLITLLSPLKKSADSVKKIAGSGYPLDKLPVEFNNEVGDLVHGFNRLIDTVNAKTHALKKAKSKLEQLSNEDGLTKVFNRRYFNDHFNQRWRTHKRSGMPISIIMLDIDYFKIFNDTYGHLEGDNCLISVAECLKGQLKRPNDFLARYGAETFVVVVDNDKNGAVQLAHILRKAVKNLKIAHEASPMEIITLSFGVASVIPTNDNASEKLVDDANRALYHSKKAGRDRVSSLSPAED